MSRKTDGVIKTLARLGVAALRPRVINGRWCCPLISRRKAAVQRKKAINDGTFGSFSIEKGGWDPAWDVAPTPVKARPYKGHLSMRNRSIRAAKIDEALKKQESLYFENKKQNFTVKTKPGFLELMKKGISKYNY